MIIITLRTIVIGLSAIIIYMVIAFGPLVSVLVSKGSDEDHGSALAWAGICTFLGALGIALIVLEVN